MGTLRLRCQLLEDRPNQLQVLLVEVRLQHVTEEADD